MRRRRGTKRSPERREPGCVPLLAEVLHGTPRLPDALCRRQPRLFDCDHPDQVERENQQLEAQRLCARCPDLEPCGVWLNSLRPSERPHGVLAGRLITSPRERKQPA